MMSDRLGHKRKGKWDVWVGKDQPSLTMCLYVVDFRLESMSRKSS